MARNCRCAFRVCVRDLPLRAKRDLLHSETLRVSRDRGAMMIACFSVLQHAHSSAGCNVGSGRQT